MFEDSYLDSFMEGYIGNWSGDEDRMFDEQYSYRPEEGDRYDDDDDDEEMDEYDSNIEIEYPHLDDQHDY